LLKYCLLITAVVALHSIGWSQVTVSGKVTADGQPLIGVSIAIQGTSIGTVTDFDGTYSLDIPGNSAILEYSYLGYRTETFVANQDNNQIDVVMQEDIASLDEIVVTGLASTVKRSNLAHSVASIDAKALTGVTSQSTMEGALYGKFKGAEIRSNSGAPGGGFSVKLRGVTSIFGDQQPLYIVDGIYIDNSAISLGTNVVSAAAGGGNTATNQDDASNRIADIDPEDVESIEILKGASAAAIYGSRAAGGVVIITTKRGVAGKTRIQLSQTSGIVRPISLLGDRGWDQAKITENFGADEAARASRNGINDYEAELFDHNRYSGTTRLNISGGDAKTKFFVGGTYKDENGLVENTGYQKTSGRININHKLATPLNLTVTSNYINSRSDRGFFNNGNTNTTVGYALAFTRPWDNLFPDAEGNYPANPRVGSNVLETVNLVTNSEKINRFIGGGKLDWDIFTGNNQNLKAVIAGGIDNYTLRSTGIFPQNLSFYRDPASLGGVSISGSTVNFNTNLSAFLVHYIYTPGGLSFRTQAGVTKENFNLNTVVTTATGLNGSQTNVDQAASVSGFQNREIQEDKGFFVQEEVNWNDRILVTVGLRGDKSSNNGDPNELFFYPKASLALNLHEFDFWGSGVISNLKLRGAFGQSGRFANFPDRFNALEGTLIGLNSGLQTVNLRGNTSVTPEIQQEIEVGADIGLLDNRLNFDITYYRKSIDDLLLRAQIPTSTGYTRQVVNAGELANKGWEIGLEATPVTGEFNWTTSVNWWTNESEVTRLDIPAFNLGGFAASLGQYRIQEGRSATQIVGTINTSDCLEADCSDLDPDGDGFRVYGDAEADFNMSFFNTLNWKNFELSFLWHWKEGGDGINLSTLLWDLAGLTWDYDDKTLDPSGEQGNGDFRLGSWFAGDTGPWIEDTGYLRLREVGLYYTIPRETLGDVVGLKLGLSGMNLVNIFDYNSYDPEVSNFGGNVLANTVEVTPFPSSKRMNFHIIATF
ncbi:MAG: SusC/RagA family TonB-linked outer membrane protein, partial [Saprospiraceae bacterium]|nr:SusC/RagA family TonB-linked outer membrane protein [Saprospiraceae bacterium]